MPDARDALLIVSAAHSLEVELTLRGRWLDETYIPTGRSRVRGVLVRLAPGPAIGDGPAPVEYQVVTPERTWTFFPGDVVDMRAIWTSPLERHRLPTEEGHVSLRCPKCACIASYPSHEPTVHCTNCRTTLRVPQRD